MAVTDLNVWVAIGTVGLQIGAVALLALYFLREQPILKPLADLASKWGILAGFLLSVASIVMSLVYSEYFGIEPCGLCWFQRIFLYPQAILFGIALFKRDAGVWVYSVCLSVLGAAVSLYHHYIQITGTHGLPCPASGGDCGKRFIYEFDYITFPLVAFSMFAFLIVLMLFVGARKSTE